MNIYSKSIKKPFPLKINNSTKWLSKLFFFHNGHKYFDWFANWTQRQYFDQYDNFAIDKPMWSVLYVYLFSNKMASIKCDWNSWAVSVSSWNFIQIHHLCYTLLHVSMFMAFFVVAACCYWSFNLKVVVIEYNSIIEPIVLRD